VAWLGTGNRSRLLHITGELRDAWRVIFNASTLGLDQDKEVEGVVSAAQAVLLGSQNKRSDSSEREIELGRVRAASISKMRWLRPHES
jgi:hypothetical protein